MVIMPNKFLCCSRFNRFLKGNWVSSHLKSLQSYTLLGQKMHCFDILLASLMHCNVFFFCMKSSMALKSAAYLRQSEKGKVELGEKITKNLE